MIEVSSFLSGKNLCNIFADLIVKKINEEFPDAKTQISVINVRNFFIVKGVTTSDIVVNLANILSELYEKYNSELTDKVRIIDSILYNKSFESNLHISFSDHKKPLENKLFKICNELQSEGYYVTIKVVDDIIFYDFDHPKEFDPKDIELKFSGYVCIKDDFSQEIYQSDTMYGLSNNGLKYYYFLLNKISFNLLNRGFTNQFNVNLSSDLKINEINSDNVKLKINSSSVVKPEDLKNLILDNFDFSLENLEKEFNLSKLDILSSLSKNQPYCWENYENTKDLMFL